MVANPRSKFNPKLMECSLDVSGSVFPTDLSMTIHPQGGAGQSILLINDDIIKQLSSM